MTREEIINLFIDETFAGDSEAERSALLGYEAFKERKAALNPNYLIGDGLYREYAENFYAKMKVVCMLRQYEEYRLNLTAILN